MKWGSEQVYHWTSERIGMAERRVIQRFRNVNGSNYLHERAKRYAPSGVPIGVPPKPSRSPEESTPQPALGMGKVLVVDDDDAVRNVMAQILAVLGYDVVTAANGLDAIDLFGSHGEQIHLVVTDLRMPVMNGYEVVDRIRKLRPVARIICMSSYSTAPHPDGTTFLAKPFTLAAVKDCVAKAMISRDSHSA